MPLARLLWCLGFEDFWDALLNYLYDGYLITSIFFLPLWVVGPLMPNMFFVGAPPVVSVHVYIFEIMTH